MNAQFLSPACLSLIVDAKARYSECMSNAPTPVSSRFYAGIAVAAVLSVVAWSAIGFLVATAHPHFVRVAQKDLKPALRMVRNLSKQIENL